MNEVLQREDHFKETHPPVGRRRPAVFSEGSEEFMKDRYNQDHNEKSPVSHGRASRRKSKSNIWSKQ